MTELIISLLIFQAEYFDNSTVPALKVGKPARGGANAENRELISRKQHCRPHLLAEALAESRVSLLCSPPPPPPPLLQPATNQSPLQARFALLASATPSARNDPTRLLLLCSSLIAATTATAGLAKLLIHRLPLIASDALPAHEGHRFAPWGPFRSASRRVFLEIVRATSRFLRAAH